jgi:rieske iron-sulfur protein
MLKSARMNGDTRRDFVFMVSIVGLAEAIASHALAQPENERPKEGDVLVSIESESSPVPLQAKDIPSGGPSVLAWPMDPASNLVRNGSRLNKVLLLRLDPATLIGGNARARSGWRCRLFGNLPPRGV